MDSVSPATRRRIDSVDVARGIAMILMALDHTRDYFGDAAVNPQNIAQTTVPLFFTRWITHFCAPTFFLLTGLGARLALDRRTRSGLSRFLISRGIWLVVLECTFMRALWQFNVDYRVTLLTVLWALGWSMIVLGLLVHLPDGAIAAFGLLLIGLHNLVSPTPGMGLAATNIVRTILHQPGFLVMQPRFTLFDAYPLIPWIGVTAVGYVLGAIYRWSPERRRTLLFRVGLASVALFVVIRAINVYGDPLPWSHEKSAAMTFVSFLNVTKYPPSLLFLLMTLGPACLVLRAMDDGTPMILRPALIIGRVPLFYYVLHVAIIHTLAVIAALVRFGDARPMFSSPTLGQFPITQPPGWPSSLPVVYLAWITVVLIAYPFCRWYSRVKARGNPWLSYL